MGNGLHLMGGVDTVVDKLVELGQMGVEHVMTMHNFGAMPAAAVERSMRLLAEEVMPRVRKRLA
jgi:metal-dependent hydrolase (beta-lactamase superfamily II)